MRVEQERQEGDTSEVAATAEAKVRITRGDVVNAEREKKSLVGNWKTNPNK